MSASGPSGPLALFFKSTSLKGSTVPVKILIMKDLIFSDIMVPNLIYNLCLIFL